MQKKSWHRQGHCTQSSYLFVMNPPGLDPKTALLIDELIHITHENNITTIINTHDMNFRHGDRRDCIFS